MARFRNVAALVAVLGFAPAAPAAGAGPAAVLVQSIALAGDYAETHRVYATAARARCTKDCALLLTSTDGGARWTAAPARGWSGGELATARRDGRAIVLSAGPDGVRVSADAGATFTPAGAPGERVTIPAPDAPEAAVSAPAAPVLYRVADGAVRALPPFAVRHATLYLSPGRAGGPAALVAGTDPSSGFPVVERCDAEFRCGHRIVLGTRNDVPRLWLSPAFDRDGVVVATTVSGSALLSRDHGATFLPVTVQPPGADSAVTTVQAVAFTPDYDAARGTGAVYASVLSVRNGASPEDTVHGGVYRAADPGGPWRRFGGPSRLDTGSTYVVAAPDGRVYAAYLDARRGRAGVLCARGSRWGSGCAFPRRAEKRDAAPAVTARPAAPTSKPVPARPTASRPAPAAAQARGSEPPGRTAAGGGPGAGAGAGVAGLLVLAGALLLARQAVRRGRLSKPAAAG